MIFDTFFRAAGSVICCLLQPRRDRPKTVLRSLCVAAFDFAARMNGRPLGREERRTLACFLDLGALVNDHFDQHRFRDLSYRRLRRRLTAEKDVRAAYLVYFRQLRRVERGRPQLRLPCRATMLEQTAAYREDVVRLSLAALAAIALGRPQGVASGGAWQSAADDPSLSHLFPLVMLLQLCDDLLDWRGDWRDRLPSFATAALLQSEQMAAGRGDDPAQVRADMRRMAAAYLAAMPKRKSVYWPFTLCTWAVWLLVRPLGLFATLGMRRRGRPARPQRKLRWSLAHVGRPERRSDAIALED
jgi:hypothetical protein